MSRSRNSRLDGFTLVELMIVVAIIGVLAAVAVPSFQNYQLTSKRVEAFSNLASLGKAQKAYFAEFDQFLAVAPEPWFTTGQVATSVTRDSAPLAVAFFNLGWISEGDVFFDYDTATGANPLAGDCAACTSGCFTSSAYGDLDGDGLFSILILAHPDGNGNYCTTGMAGAGAGFHPPIAPNGGGARQFDVVARVDLADDF